jgi:hypothetical protein
MDLKKLALAAAAGTTLLVAAPAFADHRDHRDGWRASSQNWRAPHHRHHHHYRGHYRARGYYMPPPRVYYTPPPAYYYEPSPVIYGRLPLGHHSSIGFSIPLN